MRPRPAYFQGWKRFIAVAIATGLLAYIPSAGAAETPHTFDGKHEITTIDLTVVYLVPKDRTPLADWRERVDYYVKRIEAFQTRESGGTSMLHTHVHPEPLVVDKTADELRGNNPDQTFFNSTGAAREALKWPGKREGFPIILVLSEINWRELDDFHRTRVIDGKPTHEGNVAGNGRHFPGAESGGARATYLREPGMGVGLVSADGWRVPYSGSDCVIYHEGVGHAIGLPHPEPVDDSVMGVGQYHFWINQSRINKTQRKALGWPDADTKTAPTDLFTAFTAIPNPAVPKPDQPVSLDLTWPDGAKVRDLKVRVQTELRGPWHTLPAVETGKPPATLALGHFGTPTPVSYRVDATLEDGQTVELRGYFQVKGKE